MYDDKQSMFIINSSRTCECYKSSAQQKEWLILRSIFVLFLVKEKNTKWSAFCLKQVKLNASGVSKILLF